MDQHDNVDWHLYWSHLPGENAVRCV
jgi:hypothetical protein